MSASKPQTVDEAFAVWQKRTFHDNQGEGLVLLEREVWRAACAYQQAVDLEAVDAVKKSYSTRHTLYLFVEIARRITGEK